MFIKWPLLPRVDSVNHIVYSSRLIWTSAKSLYFCRQKIANLKNAALKKWVDCWSVLFNNYRHDPHSFWGCSVQTSSSCCSLNQSQHYLTQPKLLLKDAIDMCHKTHKHCRDPWGCCHELYVCETWNMSSVIRRGPLGGTSGINLHAQIC